MEKMRKTGKVYFVINPYGLHYKQSNDVNIIKEQLRAIFDIYNNYRPENVFVISALNTKITKEGLVVKGGYNSTPNIKLPIDGFIKLGEYDIVILVGNTNVTTAHGYNVFAYHTTNKIYRGRSIIRHIGKEGEYVSITDVIRDIVKSATVHPALKPFSFPEFTEEKLVAYDKYFSNTADDKFILIHTLDGALVDMGKLFTVLTNDDNTMHWWLEKTYLPFVRAIVSMRENGYDQDTDQLMIAIHQNIITDPCEPIHELFRLNHVKCDRLIKKKFYELLENLIRMHGNTEDNLINYSNREAVSEFAMTYIAAVIGDYGLSSSNGMILSHNDLLLFDITDVVASIYNTGLHLLGNYNLFNYMDAEATLTTKLHELYGGGMFNIATYTRQDGRVNNYSRATGRVVAFNSRCIKNYLEAIKNKEGEDKPITIDILHNI